ncbi:MAG: tetrahydrofolate dehydrogenase/cyclohydrolase catalytic domain-containing protein [Gemmatimonadales bacterium]|nr:bifunctional 5,10-methylene-tetrahydrofolate dehydrogenase/5,10-methylene-tetrahydrofolate cyclohydrolase [Gemmatimonadales bacterium]MDX2059001.1 tetrahydrofolate dehydrogenase/cyclohydrolase catalytic domain-containing protein [Gemmatimonadales bacterium]
MTARVLDGTRIADEIRRDLAGEVAKLVAGGVQPGLAVVIVGEDPASKVYVASKGKACVEAGMHSETIRLPAETTEAELLATVDRLNADPRIHGFLVQLPLPKHINSERVLLRINPAKDVDGFHPMNVGRLSVGDQTAFRPATPFGVQQMLIRSGIETKGMHAVIVGRSNIVGKPMASLLVQDTPGGNCTVTICHSRSRDLPAITRLADLLVVAIGKPEFVTADMVKPGAVVIDVGINRVSDSTAPKGYRIVGDVAYGPVAEVASAITPVPGGVGKMTIAMLLMNTVQAARQAGQAGGS